MPSFAHMMLPRRAPVLFTSLAGKPLYMRWSTNTWHKRIDVRRRHAVERDADEVHRRLEPDARQHAVVAADDHHVQRRVRIVDGRLHRELARAAHRLSGDHARRAFRALRRRDQVERAAFVVLAPASPVLALLEDGAHVLRRPVDGRGLLAHDSASLFAVVSMQRLYWRTGPTPLTFHSARRNPQRGNMGLAHVRIARSLAFAATALGLGIGIATASGAAENLTGSYAGKLTCKGLVAGATAKTKQDITIEVSESPIAVAMQINAGATQIGDFIRGFVMDDSGKPDRAKVFGVDCDMDPVSLRSLTLIADAVAKADSEKATLKGSLTDTTDKTRILRLHVLGASARRRRRRKFDGCILE